MCSLDQDAFRFIALLTVLCSAVHSSSHLALAVPAACGSDEYYDGVLDCCQNCTSICPPCDQLAGTFCFKNCNHYLLAHCRISTTPLSSLDRRQIEHHVASHVASSQGEGHSSPIRPGQSTTSAPRPDSALLSNNLLLTLVVCCCTAFVVLMATVSLLLVLLWRRHVTKRCQGQPSPLMSRSSSAYSRSASSASDDKKVPLMSDGLYSQNSTTLQLDERKVALIA